MSVNDTFSSQFWGFQNGNPGTSVSLNDGQIQNSDPGIGFSGQEAGGIYVDTREVAGSFWVAQNAIFNKTTQQWNQIITSQPSYATQFVGGQTLNWYVGALGGTLPAITWVAAMLAPAYSYLRNKIINGGGSIDQRNNGAVFTPTTTAYTIDRWQAIATQTSKLSFQQLTTTLQPSAYYEHIVSLSSYASLTGDIFAFTQPIEGYNLQDLAWGTASALPVSVSVRARASVAGNYSVSIRNYAGTRSYVTTLALTTSFQLFSITVPGDTGGAWVLSGNGGGLYLSFDLGSGATFQTSTLNAWQTGNFLAATGAAKLVSVNGQTLDLTCMQLETGPVATAFEQRLYGTELSLCQRYFFSINTLTDANGCFCNVSVNSSTAAVGVIHLPVPMRANPAASINTAGLTQLNIGNTSFAATAVSGIHNTLDTVQLSVTVSGGLTTSQAGFFQGVSTSALLSISAEL